MLTLSKYIVRCSVIIIKFIKKIISNPVNLIIKITNFLIIKPIKFLVKKISVQNFNRLKSTSYSTPQIYKI